MSQLTDFVQALTQLLWPLLAAVLLWRLLPAIRKVIESRSFHIKVGDKEITVEDASEQLRQQVSDLQMQVDELQGSRSSRGELPEAPAPPTSTTTPRQSAPGWGSRKPNIASSGGSLIGRRVLWVDDNPKHNIMLAQNMRERGVHIDEALTTADGLSQLSANQGEYDLVISDMGRKEGSQFDMEAGLHLLSKAREMQPKLPFIIYASPKALAITQDRLGQFEMTACTASASELMRLVKEVETKG